MHTKPIIEFNDSLRNQAANVRRQIEDLRVQIGKLEALEAQLLDMAADNSARPVIEKHVAQAIAEDLSEPLPKFLRPTNA